MLTRLSMLGLLLVVAVGALAGPKVLIVDQTQTFMESMQVGVLARLLRTSTDMGVEITGTTEIPDGPLSQGPFQLVIIVPPQAHWVWVCTPDFPQRLEPELQILLGMLDQAVELVFRGERLALDPSEDLYTWGWSAYFLRVGILGKGS